MAADSIAGLKMRAALACIAAVVCALPAAAQDRVLLEEINIRHGVQALPALQGRLVVVEGTVASPPLLIGPYAHLAVQDEYGKSAMLEAGPRTFTALRPGDRVSARGRVSRREGLPVLQVEQIQALGRGQPPPPRKLTSRQVQSFDRMGLLVTTEGRVVERGENAGGEYLLIGDEDRPLKVFLPVPSGKMGTPRFKEIEAGDRVRVTGVASQYCPVPPFDRYFQVVAPTDEAVVLVSKRWLISPETFTLCIATLALALAFWWSRERRMSAQRKMVRTFHAMGEEMIGAGSPADIVRKLNAALVPAMKISGVNVYLYNRTSKMLDRVHGSAETATFSVPVFAPEGSLPNGPAVSFRNQALMTISDTRRSPFFPDGRPEGRPRSVMFIPMFAEATLIGVLEFHHARPLADLNADEKILAQHLANQIAIALRLMEEKSVREQLFRSEKLAAVGRLISGVAEELRAPIENISRLSESLAGELPGGLWSDLRAISVETRKASDIVARLVSLMQPARAEAKRIDLNALLGNLVEFRQDQWHERGVTVRQLLCPYPVYIVGSQGQLERVFLDLVIQAEQALAEAADKTIAISTGVLARRVLVEISYGVNPLKAAGAAPGALLGAPGESVTRGIIHSHGGDIRMVHGADGDCRIEVELPVAATGADIISERASKRQFTCLVVEPDAAALAGLTRRLTSGGCRVIPAGGAEEGLELVQRMRFDAVFCAISLPGLNWVQFAEIIRPQVGAFVLLTEGFDWELSRGLVSGDSFVLSKPIEDDDLERVLSGIDARIAETRGLQVIHAGRSQKHAAR